MPAEHSYLLHLTEEELELLLSALVARKLYINWPKSVDPESEFGRLDLLTKKVSRKLLEPELMPVSTQ